jgi:hypothetical protein
MVHISWNIVSMNKLAIVLVMLCNTFELQDPWKLEVDKKEVQVYTQVVEGFPIKAFRATSIIDGSSDQILDILLDIEVYSEWVANCKTTTLLSKENEIQYFHMEIATPFPAEARDLVQGSQVVKINSETTELRITNHPEMIEPKEGMIRMPKSDGAWTLKQINDSTTFVQLEMMNDPGGTLPDWLVNSLITGSPFKTMSNLRKKFSD